MRSRPGSAPTSSRYGRRGAGAEYGSPGIGPSTASSTAAVSRTERLTTSSQVSPPITSPNSGPAETRPRVGFSPTRPHSLAGIRIDPPPSPAVPIATIPEATAAAVPPLEPPVLRVMSHGLREGPYASGSVVGTRPSSGQLVLPRNTP